MSRSSTEVQSEIEMLRAEEYEQFAAYNEVALVAGVTGERHSPEHWLWEADEVKVLKARHKRMSELEAEHARVLREELDSATSEELRALAVLLRQAYVDGGGRGMAAPWSEMSWEALSTEQAGAWAGVARTVAGKLR